VDYLPGTDSARLQREADGRHKDNRVRLPERPPCLLHLTRLSIRSADVVRKGRIMYCQLAYDRKPVDRFDDLLPMFGPDEFKSPLRSTVPNLLFWRDAVPCARR